MFIVTGANYVGDPSATIYSYGKSDASKKHGRNDVHGLTGRVDENTKGFSAGTEAADRLFWEDMQSEFRCDV